MVDDPIAMARLVGEMVMVHDGVVLDTVMLALTVRVWAAAVPLTGIVLTPVATELVVSTVSVDVAPVEVAFTDVGLNEEQETPVGGVPQANATEPVKPFWPVTVTV